jgi:hypothetical protein
MLGRAVNLYFITKYKNISTRKPKYCRPVPILYYFYFVLAVCMTTGCDDRKTTSVEILWSVFTFIQRNFRPHTFIFDV